eukprot:m.2172 g.2172  ORF g.2172 m.2172 type:complete len:232 (+) comp8381_c0_seq2:45-740(+)
MQPICVSVLATATLALALNVENNTKPTTGQSTKRIHSYQSYGYSPAAVTAQDKPVSLSDVPDWSRDLQKNTTTVFPNVEPERAKKRVYIILSVVFAIAIAAVIVGIIVLSTSGKRSFEIKPKGGYAVNKKQRCQLYFPPGALNSKKSFSIEFDKLTAIPRDVLPVASPIILNPHGYRFQHPVEITQRLLYEVLPNELIFLHSNTRKGEKGVFTRQENPKFRLFKGPDGQYE